MPDKLFSEIQLLSAFAEGHMTVLGQEFSISPKASTSQTASHPSAEVPQAAVSPPPVVMSHEQAVEYLQRSGHTAAAEAKALANQEARAAEAIATARAFGAARRGQHFTAPSPKVGRPSTPHILSRA